MVPLTGSLGLGGDVHQLKTSQLSGKIKKTVPEVAWACRGEGGLGDFFQMPVYKGQGARVQEFQGNL